MTRTWVTAPTSLPSWIMGLPDTLMSSVGQKNFVFFCGFYSYLQVKGRFLHTSPTILKLTWMKCRKRRLLIFLSFSTNSDFGGCASVLLFHMLTAFFILTQGGEIGNKNGLLSDCSPVKIMFWKSPVVIPIPLSCCDPCLLSCWF